MAKPVSPTRIVAAHAAPQLIAAVRTAAEARPDMQLLATCRDWANACHLVRTHRPDVLTLDAALPGLPGPDAVADLVARERQRVIVTATDGCGFAESILSCLEGGAVDFVSRRPEYSWATPTFLYSLFGRVAMAASIPTDRLRPALVPDLSRVLERHPGEPWVLLGDVGAPATLLGMLPAVPEEILSPLCVAVTLPEQVLRSMARMLHPRCNLAVREVRGGDLINPQTILVLPAGYSIHVREARTGHLEVLLAGRYPGPGRGSPVDDALAALAKRVRTHVVVLSGAGQDGIAGLQAIRAAGGEVLVAPPECCLTSGLANAAAARGLVTGTLPATRTPVSEPAVEELRIAA